MTSLEGADLSGLESLTDLLQSCGINVRVEVKGIHPDQFLTSVAEVLAGLPVDVKNLVFLVMHEECIGRVVHKGAKACLALAQRFFRALALRDVPHQGQVVSPACIFEIIRADLDREYAAIPGSVAAFETQ